ncbi:hypothetical protein ASPZODRAFT_148959 [Penicilliopsis zonata CBS 506.65]|uniref:Major facilitator superfamily (MFS) profile domain-containing protein n=1 Tax=Penicilliopsis zonata CBS 506.65 TaxID=1073090 RepID=A0A1L9SX01_9EURO|nr:hypothetical protein ASPZODRAFT_148959 [Penicilliopsis zonata CBS 506.65]OJJ51732.1 hypothetical protein ASPZODRAFT_148959 [Penicilliopsis zonata CBS 506.65]
MDSIESKREAPEPVAGGVSPDVSEEATPTPSRVQPILVVVAGFLVMFTSTAVIFSFGVYQALYEAMAKEADTPFTGASSAMIGLIGTLAIALMSMAAPFVMTWIKVYPPRVVVMAGGVVFGVACVLASVSERLWQFVLTQGLLLGIGVCMAYIPAVTVSPTWFDRRRGLAMGLIIAGSALGGIVWPPVLRALIDAVGFRNALRICGCICCLCNVLAGAALRWEPRFYERQVRVQVRHLTPATGWYKVVPLVNWQVARTSKFAAQALGCFLQSAAYSTPLFFYASYAQALGYSGTAAANFITLSNASNFVSRILTGYMADHCGRINALLFTTFASTIAVLAFWLPSIVAQAHGSSLTGHALFFVFTILYGCFASAYISLFPASLIELFGVQNFTSVNGALYLVRGLGALVGTPLTGLLIPQATALTAPIAYERAAITVGVLLFAATVAIFWARVEVTLGGWKWKV